MTEQRFITRNVVKKQLVNEPIWHSVDPIQATGDVPVYQQCDIATIAFSKSLYPWSSPSQTQLQYSTHYHEFSPLTHCINSLQLSSIELHNMTLHQLSLVHIILLNHATCLSLFI